MGSTQFGEFNVRFGNRPVFLGRTLLTYPITTEILPRFYPSSLQCTGLKQRCPLQYKHTIKLLHLANTFL